MKSITYGEVSFEGMCGLIKRYLSKDRSRAYKIAVGTDSQNYDITKTVVVVAVWRIGSGGIFFYDIRNVKRITNIRQKIFYETSLSLEMANRLSVLLQQEGVDCEIDIHVDAGEDGPSVGVIQEIVGWVKACGYDCKTKPEAYAAFCIANKYSK